MSDTTASEPTRDGLPPMPPGPPHEERHLAQDPTLRALIAGAAEGVVLPFALAVVLAAIAPGLILPVGLAATLAGAVAAALGHYLAVRGAVQNFAVERAREEEESRLYPDRERWEVAAILHRYGVRGDTLRQAVEAIAADRRRGVDFMMRFELDLQEPDPGRAAREALLGAVGHVGGGVLVLLPWLLPGAGALAFGVSALLATAGLVGFGWLRARGLGGAPSHGAAGTLAIGAAASALALLAAGFVAR
jgi:VIT1/CCC1 family predicted Fe2+/Mn2+ transporter